MSVKFISYENLQQYHGLITDYIDTADAKSIKRIAFDNENKKILFYKTETAPASGPDTAAYEIDIPADLDSTATIASVTNDVVTIKAGLVETDGIVSNNSSADITLAKAAKTGAAEDISYTNTTSGLSATNVQDAIDAVAAASSGGVDSKTIYCVETAGSSTTLYSKRYTIYQGSEGSSASPVVAEKIVDIDLAKDMVVDEGSVVDITYNTTDGKLYDGSTDVTELIKGQGGTATAADAGKYIKLIIANATNDVLYIAAQSLVDIYTAQQSAAQIQLAISNSNEISATVVAGSITATELASNAVTTAKIADDAVTADKVAISAHSESQTAGADGLAISVTTTDGQVSAVSGSIAANTYDAYGAAAAAVAALDSDTTDSGVTSSTSSVTNAITGMTITDGKISAFEYTALGQTAYHDDTYFMKSSDYSAASTADISSLFD